MNTWKWGKPKKLKLQPHDVFKSSSHALVCHSKCKCGKQNTSNVLNSINALWTVIWHLASLKQNEFVSSLFSDPFTKVSSFLGCVLDLCTVGHEECRRNYWKKRKMSSVLLCFEIDGEKNEQIKRTR